LEYDYLNRFSEIFKNGLGEIVFLVHIAKTTTSRYLKIVVFDRSIFPIAIAWHSVLRKSVENRKKARRVLPVRQA